MKAVEELTPSVGTAVACDAIGVPRATVYRQAGGEKGTQLFSVRKELRPLLTVPL
jgi:hypothetical protein